MNKKYLDETIGLVDMGLLYATPVLLVSVVFYLSEQASTNFSKMLCIGVFWSLILLVRILLSRDKQ